MKTLLGPPEEVPIDSLISPRAEREWTYWTERYRLANDVRVEEDTTSARDTVGAVVICENGEAAAGVSRFVTRLYPAFRSDPRQWRAFAEISRWDAVVVLFYSISKGI